MVTAVNNEECQVQQTGYLSSSRLSTARKGGSLSASSGQPLTGPSPIDPIANLFTELRIINRDITVLELEVRKVHYHLMNGVEFYEGDEHTGYAEGMDVDNDLSNAPIETLMQESHEACAMLNTRIAEAIATRNELSEFLAAISTHADSIV